MIPITQSVTAFNGALDLSGWTKSQGDARGARRAAMLEAARLICDVHEGRTDPFFLKQAFAPTEAFAVAKLMQDYPKLSLKEYGPVGGMSVTDFGALNLDVLDRMLYGYWNAVPILSKPMVRAHTLNDFRSTSRYLIDGATTPPEAVPPGSEPKAKNLINNPPIQYAPLKYEAFTRIVWEAMINDDLGIFKDLAMRLVLGANRGIELFLTGMYVDANGPNANLYKTGFNNQIITANGAASNNPPLDVQGLQDAFKVLARQVDADGYPIIMQGKMYLWFGPALVATANNLLHMLSVQVSVNGGTANAQGFPTQFVDTNNWMVQNLTPIMNPFIRLVCTTPVTQDTMWGLTIDPSANDRPAMEFGTLRGFDTPQIFEKAPNTMSAGGGLRPDLGDFYSMAREQKVLMVYGGTQISGNTTVASTGRGV